MGHCEILIWSKHCILCSGSDTTNADRENISGYQAMRKIGFCNFWYLIWPNKTKSDPPPVSDHFYAID